RALAVLQALLRQDLGQRGHSPAHVRRTAKYARALGAGAALPGLRPTHSYEPALGRHLRAGRGLVRRGGAVFGLRPPPRGAARALPGAGRGAEHPGHHQVPLLAHDARKPHRRLRLRESRRGLRPARDSCSLDLHRRRHRLRAALDLSALRGLCAARGLEPCAALYFAWVALLKSTRARNIMYASARHRGRSSSMWLIIAAGALFILALGVTFFAYHTAFYSRPRR